MPLIAACLAALLVLFADATATHAMRAKPDRYVSARRLSNPENLRVVSFTSADSPDYSSAWH